MMDLYISGSKNVSLCVSFKNRSITVHPHILFEIISYLKQSNLRILPLVLLILLETFYLVGCCWPIFYSILLFFSGILRYFVAENSLLHRIFVYFFFRKGDSCWKMSNDWKWNFKNYGRYSLFTDGCWIPSG